MNFNKTSQENIRLLFLCFFFYIIYIVCVCVCEDESCSERIYQSDQAIWTYDFTERMRIFEKNDRIRFLFVHNRWLWFTKLRLSNELTT